MKHIFYILIFCIAISCCTSKKEESEQNVEVEKQQVDYRRLPPYTKDGRQINNTNDDILAEDGCEILHPGDTAFWPIPGFPDTITVAFTRNGIFVDSVKAKLYPGKEFGYEYVYVYRSVVGDAWYYNRDGKFLRFICVSEPHSGQPHKYKP